MTSEGRLRNFALVAVIASLAIGGVSLASATGQAQAGKKQLTSATPSAPVPHNSSGDSSSKSSRVSAVPGQKPPEPKSDVKADDSYRIGVEDALQISVWREPELSTEAVVRPDGMITLPLVNDVPVVGLSTKELQDLLTEKLKAYVTEPQVTVIVRGIRSRKVYLIGQVGHSGAFSLNGNQTVLQLITEAGGLGPFAKADSIYVLRDVRGKQVRLKFNYKKAVKGTDSTQDFPLLPGDMIVVP